MYILPDNVLWHIWQYIGVKSYFLDKLLITIIAEKRQVFHTKPLRIHYELWRIKKKTLSCWIYIYWKTKYVL